MPDRVHLNPAGPLGAVPLLPHQMRSRITPASDVIVLCHLGVPQIEAETWTIAVDGLVRTPRTFSLAELRAFPYAEIETVHQCAGSPLDPAGPTQRVSNVIWGGYRLADVLAACQPLAEANYVWSFGVDWGVFEGFEVDAYCKDLPISRLHEDVLLAVAMNGAPLTRQNGFPIRLFIPGFYGTNSVKWLKRLTLAAERADGPFTTRFYNDPVLENGHSTGGTRPVWSIAPQSVIVAPAPAAQVTRETPVEVWGWAWADHGIASVTIEVDGDATIDAELEPRRARAWQRYSARWRPQKAGKCHIGARAVDEHGTSQPADGARNAVHRVEIDVI